MRARVLIAACLVAGCSKGGPAQQTAAPVPPKPEAVVPAPPAPEAKPTPPPESDKVSITSKSADAVQQFKEGRQLYDDQRFAEATPHLKKALELDPDFALANFYLGSSTPGNEGVKMVERSVELAKAVPEPERKFIEAGAAQFQGDAPKARALLREVAAAKPKDEQVQEALAQLAFTDEDWSEAVTAGQKALDLDPKAYGAYNLMAYGHAWQGHYDEAIAVARKQVEAAPNEPNPHDTLAEILLAANRLDEALAEFEAAAAKDAKFTAAQNGAAVTRMYKGDWKGGYAALKKAHDTAARPIDALSAAYIEAWALAGQGKVAEMLKVYDAMQAAAESAKLDAPHAFIMVNRAYTLALVGKSRDAVKQAELALAKAKELGVAGRAMHNVVLIADETRLIAAWKAKNAAEAEKAYLALEAEETSAPMGANDRSRLARAQGLDAWSKGDVKGAVEAMKRCSALDDLCRFWLVAAERAAGDKAAAAETLKQLRGSPRRDGTYVFSWASTK